MQFVEKVREYVNDDEISNEAAVEKAVDYCIDNHILVDFFRKRKPEVIKVMTIDMTFEAREKIFTKEAYEDGIQQGIQQSIKNAMASLSMSFDEVCDCLKIEDREKYRSYFN